LHLLLLFFPFSPFPAILSRVPAKVLMVVAWERAGNLDTAVQQHVTAGDFSLSLWSWTGARKGRASLFFPLSPFS